MSGSRRWLGAAPWLVFDRGAGALLDGNGATVAPLERITLEQVWQAGSSSKALAVRHPDGRVVIARGNPFGDSIDAVEHALRQRLGTR
ncbi:MAG: hypothetical protein K8M05_08660 [Deltaproteobacteria bacterium]|nr:hypothetical protein [Kofleriaceae bacterium]